MVRVHIYYSGRVQGVGFRFTVQRCAHPLGLKGWVKNLPDGRVEILAEGPEEKIEQLCRKVEEDFQGYIRAKEMDSVEAQGQFQDFKIAF